MRSSSKWLWAHHTIHHAALNKATENTSFYNAKNAQLNTRVFNHMVIVSLLNSCFQLCSQDALQYTPGDDFNHTANCTEWYATSSHGSTLPSTLPRGKPLPSSWGYMLPYMVLHRRVQEVLECRFQAPGEIWWETCTSPWMVGSKGYVVFQKQGSIWWR